MVIEPVLMIYWTSAYRSVSIYHVLVCRYVPVLERKKRRDNRKGRWMNSGRRGGRRSGIEERRKKR